MIYEYGENNFMNMWKKVGVDGLIVVDLPYPENKEFSKKCKKKNIKGLRFHDLRHEAISRLFEKGLNPMEVSSISGHKSMQVLKRYTHIKTKYLLRKINKV